MRTCKEYRRRSVLLALSFVLLFMFSSTSNYNVEQLPRSGENYFSPIDNMTPALGTEDYVDSNLSDIDSSPDIGTHSSFNSQQVGPG
ncbi:MAG: hypothetical protein ACW974_10170, partial [Candidatus Thorarchaeota archaeon]